MIVRNESCDKRTCSIVSIAIAQNVPQFCRNSEGGNGLFRRFGQCYISRSQQSGMGGRVV